MLNAFGVSYPKEDSDKVDTLRYSVQKLFNQAVCIYQFLFRVPYFHLACKLSVKVSVDIQQVLFLLNGNIVFSLKAYQLLHCLHKALNRTSSMIESTAAASGNLTIQGVHQVFSI